MDFLTHYLVHPLFKWIHIIAGVMWIGILYFFNFINGAFAGTMDAETKRKVVPELMPRALFWFRWGAFWTWISGVILLLSIFWIGNLSMGELEQSTKMIDSEKVSEVTPFTHFMLLLTFLSVFIYDFIYKSFLAKNVRLSTLLSFALIGLMIYLMTCCAGFTYRALNIHIGAMFGTIMAFNVWFRIWPAQQQIITAIKDGNAPEGDDVALAGLRSKHNTYLSVPLIWTMINEHTISLSGKLFNVEGLVLLVVIAVGWHVVFQFYKKSGKITGF